MFGGEQGIYPIFFYPQSASEPSEAMRVSTTISNAGEQSIDFSINHVDPSGSKSTLNVGYFWPVIWFQPGQMPLIERTDTFEKIKYSLDGSTFDEFEDTIDPQNKFEFSTVSVTFYFGNYPSDNPSPGTIWLYDFYFDPSDSCGGCG